MSSTKDPETPTTITEVQTERRACCGCCDCLWLVTTVEGWLKLLQWITTFLAFVIILAFFNVPIEHYSEKPEYHFMIFVAITSWVFISIHIILRVSHLFEKLPAFLHRPVVGITCSVLATVWFLVASSVVLAYAKGWSELKASAACGYVAMFLFLFEAIYIFIRGKRAASTEARDASAQTKTKEKTEKTADEEQSVKLLNEENKEEEKKEEQKKEEQKKEEEKKEEEKKEDENAHAFPP